MFNRLYLSGNVAAASF